MRWIMIKHLVPAAALLIAAAVTFDQAPMRAVNAPWCAVLSMGRGDAYWDCQYFSLEDCVPQVIAGNRGFCNANPAYRGDAGQGQRRHKKRVRMH
jgi:Protein of unknown function (DUF3551)